MAAANRLASVWITRSLGILGIAFALALDLVPGANPGIGKGQGLLLGIMLLLFVVAPRIPAAARERLALLAVAAAVCVGVAEGVLRTSLVGQLGEPYRPHPRWLWEHIPLYSSQVVNPEGVSVLLRVNRDGHIGPAPTEQRPRVVVYGDSFVAGREVAEPDRFVARLAQALENGTRGRVQAINAGVRAYGPDQELMRLEADLRSGASDLVIVVLYAGNDFSDPIRNGLFRLDRAGRLAFAPARLDPELERGLVGNSSGLALQRLWRVVQERWRARTPRAADPPTVEGIDVFLRAAHERFEAYQAGGAFVRFDSDRFNADVALEPESESARASVALFKALLKKMGELTRKSRTRLLTVGVPFVLDVCPDHAFGRIEPSRYPDYRRARTTEIFAETARELQIPRVDLFPAFSPGNGCRWYFRSDDHWNASAQAAAASLVAKRIQALGLLEAARVELPGVE